MQTNNSRHLKMPFHIVKRLDMSKRNYWIIKVIGFVFAFLCAGIICTIFKPGTFGKFYERMIPMFGNVKVTILLPQDTYNSVDIKISTGGTAPLRIRADSLRPIGS